MLSSNLWDALNKATRHLKEHIGKKVFIKDKGICQVVDYTLSTQIVLKTTSGDTFCLWYDNIKDLLK